ncbi:hypothetical protein B0O99DRAFT_648963 [Bisporella sp. PMI_857]|nr:hypothetical protein B0O99DRAFT_648963 [Bisporella sp. PMI_857]
MSSQPPRESTAADEDEDGILSGQDDRLAVVVRDSTNWLSMLKNLQETDVIILLTPVVVPISQDPTDLSDPFEPLGRSLAKRHPRVRHVPYTQRNGITSTHLGFIKRGQVIILCFDLRPGQQIQLEFADIAFAVSDNKPCIIVICCSPLESHHTIPFPTLIQTKGYSPPALEATAALLFGEQTTVTPTLRSIAPGPVRKAGESQPKLWPVEQWNEARDMASVLSLWSQSISNRFTIDYQTLSALLRRPGYAKHYVVRDPRDGEILGFCATYLSYVDQEGEKLIASLALLLVRAQNRNQGIGLSLHSHAIDQLKRTRGVVRLQLGSTFPRILYGPPFDMHLDEEWFHKRGWQLNNDLPGQGQTTYDLVLDFADWHQIHDAPSSSNMKFRLCAQEEMVRVLALVEDLSSKQGKMGWFDQYSSLMNGPNVKDVVLALDKDEIIATALTYTPSCGSQIASNLPWASRLGHDVGGVTCICILLGLLNACVANLTSQGMRKMFLDGISKGLHAFRDLGFKEWARYKDVWKDT